MSPASKLAPMSAAIKIGARTPVRYVNRFCVIQKMGFSERFTSIPFAPDCRKICSRSSPVPRHSGNADALDDERFQQFIERVCVAVRKLNVAPRFVASRFFTCALFKISRAFSTSVRHLKDICRLHIFCPSSSIVPGTQTSLPRSMMAAVLQKPESSVRMCEEIKTAFPASRNCSRIFRNSIRPSGSRPARRFRRAAKLSGRAKGFREDDRAVSFRCA